MEHTLILLVITGFAFSFGHVSFIFTLKLAKDDPDNAAYPMQAIEEKLYRRLQLATNALVVNKTLLAVSSARECAGMAAVHNWYHFRHSATDLRCEIGNADLNIEGDIVTYARGEAQNYNATFHSTSLTFLPLHPT